MTVTGFRSYGALRLDCDGRSVVLTGDNGAGKTNLLEALSLLTPGRGLRGAKMNDLRQRTEARDEGLAPWAVAATVAGRHGPADIGTGIDSMADSSKRAIRIDGENKRTQSDLAHHLSMLWLTPQMDRLFQEGPSARRRFLDRMVFAFDPAHAGRVSSYEQALRERSKLLTAGSGDPVWLSALEDTMAKRGIAVAAARLDLAGALDAFAADDSGPFPHLRLWVEGTVEQALRHASALEAEDILKHQLSQSRGRDAETGGAAVGPHRSDLCVRHGPKNQEANLCSTGEQKALLITIVLSHARLLASEKGCLPILLLDEVAAHLDHDKRGALFEALSDLGAQTWLTGTDREIFQSLAPVARFFQVGHGTVVAQDNE